MCDAWNRGNDYATVQAAAGDTASGAILVALSAQHLCPEHVGT